MAGAKRFRAVIEPLGGGLGWVVARVPFDVQKTWKKMIRLRVIVEAGGESFRTSLFADETHGHYVLVNKQMQKAAGVKVGGMIDLTVSPDLEERKAAPPPELAKLLKHERHLTKWYESLSDSMRREIAKYIDAVKSAETRQKRAEQMAERLLAAMEGEKVLPPIFEVAFRRNPVAEKGWKKMTDYQRRGHLLGVFYYQSPEARERRVQKVVVECLKLEGR
jgi:uncharacterized protein YdeI (YjbR/CyaY-like superfamily)